MYTAGGSLTWPDAAALIGCVFVLAIAVCVMTYYINR